MRPFIFSLFIFISASATGAVPGVLSLENALTRVLRDNPEIRAASDETAMAVASAEGAAAYPAPKFSVELMQIALPRFDLASYGRRRFELSQELPFFGRSRQMGKVAEHAALRQDARSRAVIEAQVYEAKLAYWRIVAAESAIHALQKSLQASEEMQNLSSARSRFGRLDRMGGIMDSMLRMDGGDLASMLPHWKQERREAQGTLNRLMGLDPSAELPELGASASDLLALPAIDEAGAWARIEGHDPQLDEARHHVTHASAMLSAARSQWLPDLMLEAGWESERSGMGGGSEATLKAGLSLPWLWWSAPRSAVKAADAELQHSRDMLAAALLMAKDDARAQAGHFATAIEELQIVMLKTLPYAEKALQDSLGAYKAGAIDAEQARQAVMGYWKLNERISELINHAGTARAGLERRMASSGLLDMKEMHHE